MKGPSGDLNPISADIYLIDWDVLCEVLLLRMRKIAGSNLGQETGFPEDEFWCFL
jgi:hypothetical protein